MKGTIVATHPPEDMIMPKEIPAPTKTPTEEKANKIRHLQRNEEDNNNKKDKGKENQKTAESEFTCLKKSIKREKFLEMIDYYSDDFIGLIQARLANRLRRTTK